MLVYQIVTIIVFVGFYKFDYIRMIDFFGIYQKTLYIIIRIVIFIHQPNPSNIHRIELFTNNILFLPLPSHFFILFIKRTVQMVLLLLLTLRQTVMIMRLKNINRIIDTTLVYIFRISLLNSHLYLYIFGNSLSLSRTTTLSHKYYI